MEIIADSPPPLIPGASSVEDAPAVEPAAAAMDRWQWRNLPLMRAMILFLALFFFAATVYQLITIQNFITGLPPVEEDAIFTESRAAWLEQLNAEQRFEFERLRLLGNLEGHVLTRRYHVASVSLLSRVWLRYLAFTTGTMLALIGATFILGKLREEATELDVTNRLSSLSLNSASPGIILAILGVFLMTTAALIPQNVDVTDGAIYLTAPNVANPAGLGESSGGGMLTPPEDYDPDSTAGDAGDQ